MEKECIKCHVVKPIESFNKAKQNKDGHKGCCRICDNEMAKKKYSEKIKDFEYLKKERKRGREKYYRLQYNKTSRRQTPAEKKISMALYRKNYPEKQIAVSITRRIKRKLKLIGIELHHWSYNPEHYTDVIQLETLKHRKAHIYLIYDQERFMYRRIDTMELLNTRKKHEAYILDCIANKED